MIIMVLSDLEKHFILSRAYHEAEPFVRERWGEDASDELWNMTMVSLTDDEFSEYLKLAEKLGQLVRRRLFELWRFMMSEEYMRERYPEEPPVVEIGNFSAGTLQIGLYLHWYNSMPSKEDNEEDEKYERRKDLHDYAFGYVNQEAVKNPLFDIDEVLGEQQKKRHTIKNIIGIMQRSRDK